MVYEITLNYWGQSSFNSRIERVYANRNGVALAYLERYYNSQGTRDYVVWRGPERLLDALLGAMGSSRAEWDALGDGYPRFAFFAKRARNGWACWSTVASRTEIERLKQERDRSAGYQVDDGEAPE